MQSKDEFLALNPANVCNALRTAPRHGFQKGFLAGEVAQRVRALDVQSRGPEFESPPPPPPRNHI